MAKKVVNRPAPVVVPAAKAKVKSQPRKDELPIPLVSVDPKFPSWLSDFRIQAIVVAIFSFLLYINTYNNEYALDDTAVILKNEYVYQGFKGVPKIMTCDAFDSYYKQFSTGNQLSGGRYRPLSIATFAIEQQFMGTVPDSKLDSVVTHIDEKGPQEVVLNHRMHIRHLFNVIWFTLSMIAFLSFLRYVVFRNSPVMALIATLLFLAHPIHTEVVANVKSRDEIMSLLFMSLTYVFAFKFFEHKKYWMLAVALVSYFLAFLSKEYSITVLILLPMAWYFFYKVPLKNIFGLFTTEKIFYTIWPYVAVFLLYYAIRASIVAPMNEDSNNDLLNNPYAAATKVEKLATEIATMSNYLKLLVWPYPLSADYSYNTIPYKDFSHWLVWLSLIVHIAMLRALVYYFKRKPIITFAITIYFAHLLLVCNLLFDIGATMGERLIYHSSIGFVIIVAWLLYEGMLKFKNEMQGKLALGAFLVVVLSVYSVITVERNVQWKNNFTLFSHDIKNSPNSVIICANVASSYIDMSNIEPDSLKKRYELHEGIRLLKHALTFHTTYVIGFFNLALAYFKLGEADSAKANFDVVLNYYPKYPRLSEFYYNLGVYYYIHKNIQQAVVCWWSSRRIQPDNKDAIHALQVVGAPPNPPGTK